MSSKYGMQAATARLKYARSDYIKQGRSDVFDRVGDMIYYAALQTFGKEYWVDNVNGDNDNTGEDFDEAVASIEQAISLSNTNIALAANVNKRNVIYIAGGTYAETLTTLPNQCDIIGLGARTAWKPLINGVMTIGTAVNSCHFYNLGFYQATAAPNVTIPSGSHGWEFHDCEFICGGGSVTYGLHVTNTSSAILDNCDFVGNPPFPTAVYVAGPLFNGCKIIGNTISAETCGIYFHTNVTSDYQTVIKDNVIGRMDPNAGNTQLTKGIDLNTDSASNLLLIHNWISAADAIEPHASAGDKGSFMCIDNHVVESTTGVIETAES